VPGSDGAVTSEEEAFEAAKSIGFPVLIKAAAGGGGRGMKVAQTQEDLYEAVSTARGEAKAAFGDDAVYMERYLQTPRHIELQVIADSFGNVCHLGETRLLAAAPPPEGAGGKPPRPPSTPGRAPRSARSSSMR